MLSQGFQAEKLSVSVAVSLALKLLMARYNFAGDTPTPTCERSLLSTLMKSFPGRMGRVGAEGKPKSSGRRPVREGKPRPGPWVNPGPRVVTSIAI